MQVIKRDGKVVDFDQSKIKIAIEKANKEVKPRERATKEEINQIEGAKVRKVCDL